MDVSIIYVNYKTSDLIIDSINSVIEMTSGIKYELIVVDNNSNDNSLNKIKEKHSDVICIQSDENLGFGRANNLALNIATGEYVLFLNPDTLLINNAIKVLYDYISENIEVGACGGNLYQLNGKPTHSFSRTFPNFFLEFLSLFYLESICLSKSKSKYFNYENRPLEVAYIIGADLLVRREILDKIGYFDPVFFMNHEETDLCYRIKKNGYRIISVPNAKIIHFEGKSDYISISRLFFLYQGQYIYFNKRHGNLGVYLIYSITQAKNNLRILQFSILRNREKKAYWKIKKETNYKAFLSFKE